VALQNGGQCMCDNSFNNKGPITNLKAYRRLENDKLCNKGFRGGGGPWRNAVYRHANVPSVKDANDTLVCFARRGNTFGPHNEWTSYEMKHPVGICAEDADQCAAADATACADGSGAHNASWMQQNCPKKCCTSGCCRQVTIPDFPNTTEWQPNPGEDACTPLAKEHHDEPCAAEGGHFSNKHCHSGISCECDHSCLKCTEVRSGCSWVGDTRMSVHVDKETCTQCHPGYVLAPKHLGSRAGACLAYERKPRTLCGKLAENQVADIYDADVACTMMVQARDALRQWLFPPDFQRHVRKAVHFKGRHYPVVTVFCNVLKQTICVSAPCQRPGTTGCTACNVKKTVSCAKMCVGNSKDNICWEDLCTGKYATLACTNVARML